MSKINFKQPKYIIPLLVLPFLIGLSFILPSFNKDKTNKNFVTTEDINAELQAPKTTQNKSKIEALKLALKNNKEYSGIQNIEIENKQDPMLNNAESLYTTDEMRSIDSINQVTAIKLDSLERVTQEAYKWKDYTKNSQNENKNDTQTNTPDSTLEQKQAAAKQREILRIERQLAIVDSIRSTFNHQEQVPETVQEEKPMEQKQQLFTVESNSNVHTLANNVNRVEKGTSNSAFNTIGKEEQGDAITAMLDETVTVSGNSRIRIRLLEDVSIKDVILERGSYLYGVVKGINGQRVLISIQSILVRGKLYKVNLSVYDNDGLPGFYIPDNLFRDLTKQIGSQAINQTFTIENSNQQLQQFLYKILMDVYKQTTQALSQTIRKEKATLKYNTMIYLINEDEN